MPVAIFNTAIAGLGLPGNYSDILFLICLGYTNGKIADDREISTRAVENVVHRVREKLNLEKREGFMARVEIVNEIWKRGTV